MDLKVQSAIEKLKLKWKTNNIDLIREKIKHCVVKEIAKLEERKQARREQAEILRKKKLKKEREEEQ